MIQFKENTWTDGRTDGQTLFYRTLPATARGPKIWSEVQTSHNEIVMLKPRMSDIQMTYEYILVTYG